MLESGRETEDIEATLHTQRDRKFRVLSVMNNSATV